MTVKISANKKVKIKEIGARDREKSDERLFTVEEEELMIDGGPFHIILPDRNLYKKRIGKYKNNNLKKNDKLTNIFESLPFNL